MLIQENTEQLDLLNPGESKPKEPSAKHTHQLIKQIKQVDQDFEFYPTTPEILAIIKADLVKRAREQAYYMPSDDKKNTLVSVMDCGAGDGRSLEYLTDGKRYAIEKSRPLLEAMDRSIFVIGADFHQQTLMDKQVEVVFSNPPYSEYVTWATKIIRESRAGLIYLVIPKRWKDNDEIQAAMELRSADAEVLGEFTFEEADRKARAVVNIVRISLTKYTRHSGIQADTNPFNIWFHEHFKINTSMNDRELDKREIDKEEVQRQLVSGGDVITVLTNLYDNDLAKLINNYKALEQLDPDLLRELGVNFKDLIEALKTKISGLKNLYWNELFDNLKTITNKLTKASRESMLNTLSKRTDVDFNPDNVYAVVIWVIKNANHYFDDQLVGLVESMVDKANVVMYKSNEKTFGAEQWRYGRRPEGLHRYGLDYRIVLECMGGICTSEWSHERTRYNGLTERAYFFLMDVLTVAGNIGFDTSQTDMHGRQWESNTKHDFDYKDITINKELEFMSVRAFKNGNIHIKFNQAFIRRLNVEFGRLKGWLKTASDAADELNISVEEAGKSFHSNLKLTSKSGPLIGFKKAA